MKLKKPLDFTLLQWPILLCFVYSRLIDIAADGSCAKDRLTVYRVIMNTFWSRELFPKHFPDWRPKAQFSKLIDVSQYGKSPTVCRWNSFYELSCPTCLAWVHGRATTLPDGFVRWNRRSHNENYKLYSMNERVSDGVKMFAETGQSDLLDRTSQGGGGVYDEFNAPPIVTGVGRTEAKFFVDGNHSQVSLMSRLIPSPDWFVGVDSVELCSKGTWLTSLTLQADPLDSGTDNGLTFTAPNWPTEPRGLVTKLTTRHPNHPASSFFDSDRESLPPIASFQFLKVKEYELSQVFNHPVESAAEFSSNDVFDYKVHPLQTNSKFGHGSPRCGVNSWCSRPRRHNHHVLFNWEGR